MIILRNIGARLGFLKFYSLRSFASEAKATQKTELGVIEYDEIPIYKDDEASEELIDAKRNKSRLNPHDRNKLHGKKPFEKSMNWFVLFSKLNLNYFMHLNCMFTKNQKSIFKTTF